MWAEVISILGKSKNIGAGYALLGIRTSQLKSQYTIISLASHLKVAVLKDIR
jgi:hypothetical protein